ncbi:Site-specific recombinase XerD [Gracilibacillus orientalis]|uniref:Site-specific recombinase XerD n=1 Tax=Gracilibacillus orientalis TaxID=334253 RepID=A0A1I4MI10_9BACI|nr:tyrosine-type recombinase/integrase [Gracilibacillus orientalis]SFM02677.1 Site-specific recombinase XerD [Gracilibacillus orientalis]
MCEINVYEVITQSEEKRWIVLNEKREPITPIMKYIKYKDSLGKAPNTLKTYCYHLKLYWEYLYAEDKYWKDIDLNILAEFIHWLRYFRKTDKVIPLMQDHMAKRSENTINQIINCVVDFYDYHLRNDSLQKDIKAKITKEITVRNKRYKGFLDHISDNIGYKNILKIKEPRRKLKTLTKEQAEAIHSACNNSRDELMIRIMYEGGLRATELLRLWIEDFNLNENSVLVRKSKTKAGEQRKVYISPETMNRFQDYIIDYHNDGIDTNYVFINLRGKNKGKPVQYWTLQALIRRINNKTGIDFTAHMLRHTYATNLHDLGVEVAIIQKLLGHSQVQTTMNMYIHPSDETIRRNWEKAHSQGGPNNDK